MGARVRFRCGAARLLANIAAMSPSFHHRNLPHLLLYARETLMAHFRPILHAAGVTEQQWRVLRTLSEVGSMEPNQIARTCQILSPSLTRMLAGMQEQGLIKRTRSSADQRRQEISLTPKSNKLIDRMRPQVEIEARIGKELLDRLYRDVDTMVELIKREPADARASEEE
jgi:homoprotocatechuate degradation regulator HpaR